MGHTTDFVGHIDIEPALNEDEINYLTALSTSRRFRRPGGPNDVPGNPRAEDCRDFDHDSYTAPAHGQPGLRCPWVPCWEGCCLSFDGNEKLYEPVPWLRYLIAHFLKPGARASRSGLDPFSNFTFDHQLDGMVVGCRRDTRELTAITVYANRVTTRTLRGPDPSYAGRPPLPYEKQIDRERADIRRRRRGAPSNVIDLSSRFPGPA
jgi:hypothetical protein